MFRTPLPFVWPYALLFWAVFFLAMLPEQGILKQARKAIKEPGSLDAGSCLTIIYGGAIAFLIGTPIAWITRFQFPTSVLPWTFAAGIAMIAAGGLLRRHCVRILGASFTGDVRVPADQRIITAGPYRFLRHPSYTGGILMNFGFGLSLGSWISAIAFLAVSLAIYSYRMNVEERVLLSALGEPYRQFMSTRKRVIPFLY